MSTVTKEELFPLFQGCGSVEDIFICTDHDRSHNYGFVRFSTADGALKAVAELNKWQLHGSRIIVDIARDTAERLKQEEKKNIDKMTKSTTPPSRAIVRSNDGDGSTALVQDIMYLSRIKETCTSLNYQVSSGTLGGDNLKTRTVDIDVLLEKVAAKSLDRVRPTKGEFDEDTNPEKIQEKLLESDRNSVTISSDRAYGFMVALKSVVGTLNSFLKEEKLDPDLTLSNVKQRVDQEEEDFNEKVDKLLDDGNISTTEENKMENSPGVDVPHQCLPVHINSNEECLKSNDDSVDDSSNKDAVKQFYFTKTLDEYDSCVTKRLSESDIDLDESIIKEPVPVLQRNISEEAEDTSNSDSDLESPSRDSGIESDAMSAMKYKRVPDQLERERILTENINAQGSCHIVKETEKSKNTSLPAKMDDCTIIQDYLKKALKLAPGTEVTETGKRKGEISNTHVPTVTLGRGRGILGFRNK